MAVESRLLGSAQRQYPVSGKPSSFSVLSLEPGECPSNPTTQPPFPIYFFEPRGLSSLAGVGCSLGVTSYSHFPGPCRQWINPNPVSGKEEGLIGPAKSCGPFPLLSALSLLASLSPLVPRPLRCSCRESLRPSLVCQPEPGSRPLCEQGPVA